MKQNFKRFLSIVLTCVMLVGMLPVSAFAAEADETTPVVKTPVVVETTTAPETTVPETTVPETTAPETTVPETTVPETTVPETTVPETTVPETTVPETTVPETTVPETTVPEETVPEVTVAEDPVQDLYDTLMAFETYEALGDYMDAMSEEQYALMDQFSDEQNNALFAKVDQLLGNDDVAVYKHGDGGQGERRIDHIDVRVAGKLTITTKINGVVIKTETVNVDVSNVSAVLNGSAVSGFYEKEGEGEEHEWRCNNLSLDPTKDTVILTFTIKGTREDNTPVNLTLTKTYTGEAVLNALIEECPADNGYDINISVDDLKESFTVDKTVTKVWNDNEDSMGARPASIQVQLYADGKAYGEPVTLNAANNWTAEYSDLPKYSSGVVEYVYSVDEVSVPDGYAKTVNGFTITNTYAKNDPFSTQYGQVYITGQKTWDDNENASAVRPGAIVVNLYADGEVVASQTVTGPDWSWSFNLSNGVPGSGENPVGVNFTIGEEPVANYELTAVKNPTVAFNPPSANGGWNKIEPCSALNISSSQNEKSIVVAKKGNTFVCWSWDPLASFERELIVQSVASAVNGISSNVNDYAFISGQGSSSDFGMTVTASEVKFGKTSQWSWFAVGTYNRGSADSTESALTNKLASTSVTVTKTWDDNDNQDGKRPASVTIHLLANGTEVDSKTITAADGWKWTFEDLDKFADSKEIVYTVTEDAVEGYTAIVDGFNVTNKHEIEKVTVSGAKTWDDNDDQDGKRPESITVKLLADGKETGDSVTVNEKDGWAWSFADLPKYAAGKEITYRVSEVEVDGYTTTVSGMNITNSHTPEKIDLTVEKQWDDNNNQDGKRPEFITVKLLANDTQVATAEIIPNADGNWIYTFAGFDKYAGGQEIIYTVEEVPVEGYSSEIDGMLITNKHAPEKIDISGAKTWIDNDDQDGKRPDSITIHLFANGTEVASKTVTAEDEWKWNFAELDKYADGSEITYTITEDAVEEYTSKVEGYNVTNTHKIETTKVEGVKTWVDNNDQDGKRPESITINLLADGTEIKEVKVSAANGWKWSFENLPVYKAGEVGQKIVYTITEDKVDGYTAEVNGFNVTNKHEIETTKVEGVKTWDDAGNQDGKRPTSITINLYGDEELVESKTVTPDENGNWAWSFENLPVYKEGAVGKKIVYTITEDKVDGYVAKVEGYNVTNTHKVDLTEVTVAKVWDDADNQDGIRPASVTVQLKADGEAFGDPVVLSSSNEWTHIFTNLEVNKKGKVGVAIDYTVEELNVPTDYTAEVTGTQADGYTITNIHEVYKTEVSVSKVWDDADDQDGLRPESVTVMLYADNDPASEPVVLSEANGWTYTFKDLDEKAEGYVIGYTVEEMKVPADYTVAVTGSHEEGYTITNTHIPETTAVEGTKTWIDDEDRDGLRPESITINLVADDVIIETIEVTEEDGWAWSFNELPVYRDHGTEIVYEITEEAVDGYTTVIEGFNVTNTHEIATTEVKGAKTWNDDNDRDGLRPESITISLLADGQAIDTIEVTEEDGWAWSFEQLPVYRDQGTKIVYTVAEAAVEGYETVIEGFDITNTHEIATTEVKGAKTWDDANNQDGKRPASITINLVADGEIIETIEVTEVEGWAWSFTELPAYKDHGVEIVYAITENAVEGYATTYDGYNVINSYTPEETSVTVTKAWADSNNAEGIRPGSVTIRLMANGVFTGLTLELDAQSKWVGSFTGLPKYFEGELVEYTVDEVAVKGYTTVIKGNMEEGFTVTNTHVYIPQTGDDRTPMMWITMMAVSAMMIALASIDSKKRRNATK